MEPFPPHIKTGAEVIRYESLEPVRKRSLMYVGTSDAEGILHLSEAAVTNAVHEAWEGYCTTIRVTLGADGRILTVEDDGRGIPIETHPTERMPFLEVAMTRRPVHTSERQWGHAPPYRSLGTLPIGCACALSESLIARVWREGAAYEQHFARGEAVTPLSRVGSTCRHGTSLTFRPDPGVFPPGVQFDEGALRRYLRDTAAANAGLRVEFTLERTGRGETIVYPNGLVDLVASLTEDHPDARALPPFHQREWVGEIFVEVAIQHTGQDGYRILNYVNGWPFERGGSHVWGLERTLAKGLTAVGRSRGTLPDDRPGLSGVDACYGATAAVSVLVPYPTYEGSTASSLAQPEVAQAVETAIAPAFQEYLEQYPEVADDLVWRARDAQKERELGEV